MGLRDLFKKNTKENNQQSSFLSNAESLGGAYQIIATLLGEEGVKQIVAESKEIISNLILEEDIKHKTDLLIEGLDFCLYQLEKTNKNPNTTLGGNTITAFMYYRHFADCVMALDDDIIHVSEYYTIFRTTKHIPEEMHPYVQMMIKIYDLLDRGIIYLYENMDTVSKEYFTIVAKKIQKLLDDYKNDGTDWNKINKPIQKEQKEISKELFGERILSRMLLKSAEKCPGLFNELGIDMELVHYLLYLEYLLFLSKKILEQRYSNTDVGVITYSAINGLIDFMDNVPTYKKDKVKKVFEKMYAEFEIYSEQICGDIGSEKCLKNLTTSFLSALGINNGLLEHTRVFTELSGFIVYHTNDILNDEIVII